MEEINIKSSQYRGVTPTTPVNRQRGPQGASPETFDTILSTTLTPGDTISSTESAPPALQELSAPLPLIQVEESGIDLPAGVEAALDSFDRYTQLLQDPSKDLKTVDSALTDLIQRAQDLAEKVQPDREEASSINTIIDELVLTASLERIRMDRGDYLDTPTIG